MPRRSAASFAIPSVTGLPPRLSPPSDLSPDERQVFCDLAAASKPDAFRSSDSPLLAAYCRAITIERRAAAELAAGDDKALAKWNGATKAMVSLSQRLRLSPQSRAPNNPTNRASKPERPLSYYERQALQEGDHDGSA
jgi:phage terminase small subunit